MSAVSSAESIVHEEVGIGSLLRKSKRKFRHKNEDTITSFRKYYQFLGKRRVVLLLLRVKSNVLEQCNITVFHGTESSADRNTDAVRN